MSKKIRRSNGEGHYYKKNVKGIDYYCWKVDTGKFNKSGNRHFKVITAKTSKDIKDKVRAYKKETNEIDENPKIKTVHDYICLFLVTIKPTVKQRTFESYSAMSKRYFMESNISRMPIKEVNSRHIQELLNSYVERLSPVSIGDMRRCLHTIFQRAVDEKIISVNPVASTKAPRIPHKEIKVLSEVEIKKLLSTANAGEYIRTGLATNYNFGEDDSMIYNRHAFYVALCLLWYVGLRRGECWGISWDNINFVNLTLRITKNYQPAENGKGFFDDPKTQNSIRTISLPSKIVKLLLEWKKEQEEFAEKYEGIFSNKMNLVFTNMFGEGVSYSTINRYWKKLRKATGMEKLRMHDIRHNHISWLLGQGVAATEVARRVGDTVETILRVYAHAMPTQDKETAKLLDEKLNIL